MDVSNLFEVRVRDYKGWSLFYCRLGQWVRLEAPAHTLSEAQYEKMITANTEIWRTNDFVKYLNDSCELIQFRLEDGKMIAWYKEK